MGNKKGYIPWNKGVSGYKRKKGVYKSGLTNGFAGNKHSEDSKKKIGESRKGKNHPLWKGGRIIHKGYVLLHTPHHPNCNKTGYVYEHRLVMEGHLGRFLLQDEEIHHINEIKDDNRIENLQLFNNHGDHVRLHNKKHNNPRNGESAPSVA